ncbi:MAG: transglutaminase-like cysteine peptidase [Pseudorhodoplanes sp.]
MMVRRAAALVVGVVVAVVAWAGNAVAGPAFMPTGGRTSQPIGHYEFCLREPQECRQKTPRQAPIEMTNQLWAAMVRVNDDVNIEVRPMTDLEMWGVEEFWSYPTTMGDCEDYVLEKRRRLMAMGIPAGDLLIAVVQQPNGDGHAVLTVRTSRGDFVLDNLDPSVRPWSETVYTYLKRQSERNSGAWIAINDSRATIAVGSVR